MSTFIWWLESPWQIRAFVFILAFFACFVAPYLYTAGKAGTAAARRPVQVENGKQPAAKVETPVHEAQALARLEAPAPQAVSEPEPPAKTADAPRPDVETPVLHDRPEALAEAPAQQAEAPAAPAPREAAAAKPPVEPAAPAVQPPKAVFRFSSKAANALTLPALGRVERQEIAVATETGSAEVEVHVLPNRAGGRAARRGLSAYLENDAFAKGAPSYDAVVCVGLGSRGEPVSAPELLRRAGNGDFALCGILARKPYLSTNAKLYGLPLAQALEATGRAGKKRLRPQIVVGIKSAKGDLADFATQRKMIAELIRENKVAAAGLGESPKAPAAKPARYIAVKGGKSRRKLKAVKQEPALPILDDVLDSLETMTQPESWSFQDEISPRRSRGRANRPRPSAAQSKALPAGSRKMSTRRMGLFPLPPQPISRRIGLKDAECWGESL